MAAMSDVLYTEIDATTTIRASGIADLLFGGGEGLSPSSEVDWGAATYGVQAGELDGRPAHNVVVHYKVNYGPHKTIPLALHLEQSQVGTLAGPRVQLSGDQKATLQRLVEASVRAGVDGGARGVAH
jgi:hypothetical protein